jgi:hypothetical protein
MDDNIVGEIQLWLTLSIAQTDDASHCDLNA